MSLSENSDSFFDWGQAEELLEILVILCWGQLLVVSLPAFKCQDGVDESRNKEAFGQETFPVHRLKELGIVADVEDPLDAFIIGILDQLDFFQ